MFGIDDAIAAGLKIIDEFIPDTKAKEAAQDAYKLEMLKQSGQAAVAQTDIDKNEAASASMFVAGWRPFVGWVCGSACAYQWIASPVLTWVSLVINQYTGTLLPTFPHIDTGDMQQLLYAMLGLGTLRSADKMMGVSTTGVIGTVINTVKSVLPGKK